MSDPDTCEELYFKAQEYSEEEIKALKHERGLWANTKEEAEEVVNRIIIASAERAKVLFDAFRFRVVTKESINKPYEEHEYEIPSLERLVESIKEKVEGARKYGLFSGSGRIYVWPEEEWTGGEGNDLTDIKIFFELGCIPIQYLWENGPRVAIRMEKENRTLTSSVRRETN